VSIKIVNQCASLNANTTSVRRFALPESELNLEAILSRANASFGLSVDDYQLCYTDDEGDKIKVATNEEVIESLRLSRVKKDILRFVLIPTIVTPKPAPIDDPVTPIRARAKPVAPLLLFMTGLLVALASFGMMAVYLPKTSHEGTPYGPTQPMCTHYLHTIYTDPYFDSHKGDAIIFRDWRNQLKQAKVMKCGEEYYFYVDERHTKTLEYKRWNGEAWTATIHPDVKFHHQKANSGGRTSFTGRAFEVTNAAGQSWVSAVTTQHEVEQTRVRLSVLGQGQAPQPTQGATPSFFIFHLILLMFVSGVAGFTYSVSKTRRNCKKA